MIVKKKIWIYLIIMRREYKYIVLPENEMFLEMLNN